jgi:hypothetical protein
MTFAENSTAVEARGPATVRMASTCLRGRVNTYLFSLFIETLKLYETVDHGVNSVVLAKPYVISRMEQGAELPHDNSAGRYLFTTVPLNAPPLGIAVSSIPGASLSFFMCHCIVPLNGYFLDLHTGQLLTMASLFVIALSFLHLEDDYLVSLGLTEDFTGHGGAFNYGPAYPDIVVFADHENLVKNNPVPFYAIYLLNGYHISLRDPLLLAACFYHCIHGLYPSKKF